MDFIEHDYEGNTFFSPVAEESMTIPTHPAGYWHPNVSLTEVYHLRGDGTWHYNITGKEIPVEEVPDDLVLLGEYAQPYLDPEPYVSGMHNRHSMNFNTALWTFEPRPGYSQNEEDYK